MAALMKDEVNGVACAFQSRSLLEAEPRAAVGPNKIALPLARDKHKLALTLEHVLSIAECDRLIHAAEEVGFGVAGLGRTADQQVDTQLRNSGRLIVEDIDLTQQIHARLQPYLPTVWEGRRIIGLNEQLKFLRYHPGQKFVAHFDGAFCRHGTPNMTRLTVQLYLTHGVVEGGCTNFIGHNGEGVVSCTPDVGRALVFQHNLLHEGEEVREGVKYTIRTDVEYSGVSQGARLQETLGFGCSPLEQRRRFLLWVVPVCAGACSLLWTRFR